MRILVDMDGILPDFDGEFLKPWRERHPDKLYVPFEERRTFYVRDSYPDDLKFYWNQASFVRQCQSMERWRRY